MNLLQFIGFRIVYRRIKHNKRIQSYVRTQDLNLETLNTITTQSTGV
jgi:hypothetical protein